jgi:tripartite-type tricarboxylate transporter receptor subunit TctC
MHKVKLGAKRKEASMGKLIAKTSAALAAAMLALAGTSAIAQDVYPSRPVKLIVPYTPGGVGDLFARSLSQHLQDALGQPFLVENRPGASQMVGAMAVAKAPPDGYTLFLGATGSLAMNAYTQKNIRYDPVKDFAPVSLGMTMPLFLVVNPSVAASNVKELIAMLKADPGKYTFASIGSGSSTHMAAELFKLLTGTDMVHVPYKSSVPAITDVVAGLVTMSFDVGVSSLPFVKSGRLRALAVTSAQRFSLMPELPTVAEAGVPNYDASVWFGVVAPAGTPSSITTKLSQEIGRILRLPEMRERFASYAIDLTPNTPEEFGAMIKAEVAKWTIALRQAGIKPE